MKTINKTVSKPKIFVLDTNVILHDHNCIYQFQDNDVIIPITVLEELDNFKKGNELINFQAREFTRKLDRLSDGDLFGNGVQLGKDMGKLRVTVGKAFPKVMIESFSEDIPDHRIISVALHFLNNTPDRKVIMVSKDINLRMKARALGIPAEDYKSDSLKDEKIFERSISEIRQLPDELIDELYRHHGLDFSKLKNVKEPSPNEYFVLKGDNATALTRYLADEKKLILVEKQTAYGIKPRNAEQTFCLDALLNPELSLCSISGKAGTGKTLLALAAALAQLDIYDQILLARPIVALSNKDLGFLPGDAKEKIGPYMQPLFDNLTVIKNSFNPRSSEVKILADLQKEEKLVISPLAYIRGRSLTNTFVIVDEAQNLTPHEVKTIITRAGEGTKMVFTGDLDQIDTPYLDKKSNGLAYMTERMKKENIFAHVNLEKGERSKLAELASNLL
ncbi:MAG: PhoH family protein [Mangrovibacterium sp.]